METEIKNLIGHFLLESKLGVEVEIRLGKMIENRFESSVDKSLFDKLFIALMASKPQIIETFTQEESWELPNMMTLRKITDNTNPKTKKITYLIKQRKAKKDLKHSIVDLRFVSSSEIPVENAEQYNEIIKNKPMSIRNKQRISFVYKIGSIDMTIINKNKFEIEFEINNKEKQNVNDIYNTIKFILDTLEQKQEQKPSQEQQVNKNNIIEEYFNLVKSNRFVGAQPVTLHKENLTTLYKELYSVTDKADGERCFMFVNKNGQVYFLDNNLNNVISTDLVSSHVNCILDGELIGNKEFYGFDILVFEGRDLRGDNNYLLISRLKLLNDIIKGVKGSSKFSVFSKKFLYRNVFLGSKRILETVDTKSYKNDGLIFTPMNEPYPKTGKWNKLYKWKPSEMNTIDFYSVKENGIWKLYVQGPIEQTNTKQTQSQVGKVLFDVNKYCKLGEETIISYETTFDDSLIDPVTNGVYQSETVIEYSWNGKQFMPLRSRPDKTVNPKKHGNYVSVACDIWKSINNPVTTADLFNMTNQNTPRVNEKGFFFESINYTNKKIKEYILNKYKTEMSDTIKTTNNTDNKTDNNAIYYIDKNEYNKLKNKYYEIDNEIVYYFEEISEGQVKVFMNGFMNKNVIMLETINFVNCDVIENKKFSEFQMSSNIKFKDYELELLKIFRFTIYKNKNENKKIIHESQNFANIEIPNGLQFYKIKNTFDIIDIINCQNYNINKNRFENSEINTFEDLQTVMKQFNVSSIYFNNDTNTTLKKIKETSELELSFYITRYQSVNTVVVEEEIIMYGIYVIMDNYKLKCNFERLDNIFKSLKETKVEKVESKETLVTRIKNEMKTCKTTLSILRGFLKELGLEISGNKETLVNRLNEALQV
jgi:hypothetical protein